MPVEPQPIFRQRSHPWLAWLVILTTVVVIIVRTRSKDDKQHQERLSTRLEDLQSRYLIGTALLAGPAQQDKVYQEIRRQYERGPYQQRLRFAFIAGQLEGASAAREWLEHLQTLAAEGKVSATRRDQQMTKLLDRLYQARQAGRSPQLTPEEQEEVEEGYGFLAQLALDSTVSPDRDRLLQVARRTALVLQGLLLGGCGVCAVGIGLLYLLVQRKRKHQIQPLFSPPAGPGGFYAETFALWLVLYVVLSSLVAGLGRGSSPLLLAGLLVLGTLGILAWPLLRGVPWRQLRQDIGWTAGKSPGREVLFGLGTYITALPVVLLTLFLSNLVLVLVRRLTGTDPFGPGTMRPHPAVEVLLRGSAWERLQVVVTAAVVAPVVEETLFRGLLYSHLREATAQLGQRSVLVSGLLSGVIFAAIHPQGLLAVPVLTVLALAFALVREWRGSLIPAMVAHGINNGVLTLAFLGIVG